MTDFTVEEMEVGESPKVLGSQFEDFRNRIDRWYPGHEPAYLALWQRFLGESDGGRIVVAWDGSGNLVAYAPLMRARGRVGLVPVPTLRFIGNNVGYPGDILYGEVFATPPERPAIRAILAHVAATWSVGKWELGYLSPSSPTRHVAAEILGNGLVDSSPRTSIPFVSVDLSTDWDSYLATLTKKTRAEFRRCSRHFDSMGGLKLVVEETPEGARKRVEELVRNHERWFAGTAKAGWFGNAAVKAFLVSSSELLAAQSRFVSSALELNGSPIAWIVGPAYGQTYFAHVISYDQTYAAFSPGMILCLELMHELISRGFRHVDLGPGSNLLKRRLGGTENFRVPVFGYQGWFRPAAWLQRHFQKRRAG